MAHSKHLDFKVDRSGPENHTGNCGDVFLGDNYLTQKLGGPTWEANAENSSLVSVKNLLHTD